MKPSQTKFPIYCWADGTEAFFDFQYLQERFFLSVPISPHTYCMSWSVNANDRTLSLESQYFVLSADMERKLVGLFLDLGVERPTEYFPAMALAKGQSQFIAYPRWVDDKEWETRYTDLRALFKPVKSAGPIDHPFLGVSSTSFETWIYKGEATRRWMIRYGAGYSYIEDSLEEVVDRFTAGTMILPRSQQEEWEATHIEYGTFVNPTPEEVEIYRLLGSPLPLLLPADQLLVWAKERFGEES